MLRRIGNVRWGIAGLLGTGIVINYLDRVNISVATKPFEHEFHLTQTQMGIILSAYLWSYVLLQVPVGGLLDRFGVTWPMRIGTFIWGLATYMTAIVSGLGLVILSRILLGAAEAPIFPGAAKATGYWFPIKERGLATSAFDAAAKFSNVIGIPLVAVAVTLWGWRASFIFDSTGSFAANFLVAGAILVLGIVCFLFLLGPIEQIQQPQIGPEEPRIGPEVGPVASTR